MTGCRAKDGQTDRQIRTDARPFHKPCSAYYAGSANYVARLDDDTPANVALHLHINVSLNRPPGRPRNKWLDQLRNDSTCPTGDLWGACCRPWRNDATAVAGYATMMMLMMSVNYRKLP